MDRGEQTFASATRSRTVGLQVNADFEELGMLRALVETITLHADFGVDEVTDIRLAVEEVATEALLDAIAGSMLDCAITYTGESVEVRVSALTTTDLGPDRLGLGWHIVSALAESVTVDVVPDDASGRYRTTICFRWVRGKR